MKIKRSLLIFFVIITNSVLAANVETPQATKTQSKLTFEDNFLEPTYTIANSIEITVPGDIKFPQKKINTIQDALHAIRNYRIAPGTTVTIKLMQDVTDYDTINIDHPDGNRIHIVGDCGEGKNCTIQFKPGVHGVYVGDGNRLGLLDKLTLIGQKNDNKNGIYVYNGASITYGKNIVVQNFANRINANSNGSWVDVPLDDSQQFDKNCEYRANFSYLDKDFVYYASSISQSQLHFSCLRLNDNMSYKIINSDNKKIFISGKYSIQSSGGNNHHGARECSEGSRCDINIYPKYVETKSDNYLVAKIEKRCVIADVIFLKE